MGCLANSWRRKGKSMGDVKASIIRERNADFDELETIISDLLREEIYKPLIEAVPKQNRKITNSNQSFLEEKIKEGKIAYYRGKFTGKFSAKSTKALKEMGAVWSQKDNAFKLQINKLPPDVRMAISTSATRFDKTVALLRKKLSQMLPDKIAGALKSTKLFSRSIFNLDRDITKSLEAIVVTPQISDKAREKLATEYNLNMQRSIKGWTETEIIKLRSMVEKESLSGKRYENLVKIIEKRYDVSRNKAKFLARQETGLMMAKFRESRYVDSGSPGYYWTTVVGSPKHPVRKMHKELDGKYIRWKYPPITNPQGDRNHAGEDYNCRCAPRAVIRF